MSTYVSIPPAADGADRHHQLVDAVRDQGAEGLWKVIGDHAHLLAAIAQTPGEMFDVERHGSDTYVQVLRTLHEARSAIDALDAQSVVALAGATRREQIAAARAEAAQELEATDALEMIEKKADLLARTELSLATRRAPHAAGAALNRSRRIVHDMPHMLKALATGMVSAEIVYETARTLGPLEEMDRRSVDRMLGESLPELDAAGATRWKHAVTAAIGRLDPDGTITRHRRAARDRHITLTPGDHGMATLSGRMPARDAVLVRKRLSLEAERLRAEGDRRGHHAIMVDTMVDTLLGREGGIEPITLDLGMIITDRALIDPGEADVAHLEGYGPVPVECVREDLRTALRAPEDPADEPYGPDGPALRAVLRRLYTHPTTGELVAVESQARAFPKPMAKFLAWRDTICRGPFCNAVIRQSDHIRAAARGGSTSIENGQGLCAFCNKKEQQARAVERIEGSGHRVRWTSHAGTSRVTRPTPLTRPAPTSEVTRDETVREETEPEPDPPNCTDPDRDPPNRADPDKDPPDRADSERDPPGRTESDRDPPSRTESDQDPPGRADPDPPAPRR